MMPPIFWIATEPTGRLHIIDLWTDLDSLKPSATDEAIMVGFPPLPEPVDAFLGAKCRSPAVVAYEPKPSTAQCAALY